MAFDPSTLKSLEDFYTLWDNSIPADTYVHSNTDLSGRVDANRNPSPTGEYVISDGGYERSRYDYLNPLKYIGPAPTSAPAPTGNYVTKQYSDPTAPYSFNYVDKNGNVIGTGYDSYDDAILKLGGDKYESFEKYGRELTEGQKQNMFGLLLQPSAQDMLQAYGGVPDWNYHRAAYEAAYNPVAGMTISGEKALVGSTPVFGSDGKITGYKINVNPEHINAADTSGRVQSSTRGATQFDKSVLDFATPIDQNTIFVKTEDVPKLSYKSLGASSYNKEDTLASKLGEMFTKGFLGAAVGGAFGLGPLAGGQGAAGATGAATGTGAAAGSGGGSMFGDIGDWFSNLFSNGAQSIDPSLINGDMIETMSQVAEKMGTSSWTDAAQGLGFNSVESLLGSINPAWVNTPGLLESVKNYITQNPGSTAKTAIQALGGSGAISPTVVSGLLSGVGGYLSGQSAQDAASKQAQAQLEAARIAADAAKFKPVGVTTRFGQSQFQKDAAGNVTGAGYNLTPDVKAQQDALMGQSNAMLSQYTNAPAAFAPMGAAGQRAMSLGNQYLATDPAAQAQKYMQEQQALLATGRERDTNQMLTGEFNRGTYGLSTGGTSTGMMGANPRLEALYNARRQQDLGLAAQATQGGMDYAKFGAGMMDVGGALTRGMYQGQTAAYDPYKTALGGAQTIEGLGQNALDLGVNMGKVTSNAQSGMLLANGMNAAAQTQANAAYSPWGTALMAGGNALNQMTQPQQQQPQYAFNPYTGQPIL